MSVKKSASTESATVKNNPTSPTPPQQEDVQSLDALVGPSSFKQAASFERGQVSISFESNAPKAKGFSGASDIPSASAPPEYSYSLGTLTFEFESIEFNAHTGLLETRSVSIALELEITTQGVLNASMNLDVSASRIHQHARDCGGVARTCEHFHSVLTADFRALQQNPQHRCASETRDATQMETPSADEVHQAAQSYQALRNQFTEFRERLGALGEKVQHEAEPDVVADEKKSLSPTRIERAPASFSPAQKYDYYQKLIEQSGRSLDTRPGQRTVLGLRAENQNAKVYDDTAVVLWRDDAGNPQVKELNANMEASAEEYAHKDLGKDMNADGSNDLATLAPGAYEYKREVRPAKFNAKGKMTRSPRLQFRPTETTAVLRDTNKDGVGDTLDETGAKRSILFHAGGRANTHSAGCQTMPPDQFDAFAASLGDDESFTYIVMNKSE